MIIISAAVCESRVRPFVCFSFHLFFSLSVKSHLPRFQERTHTQKRKNRIGFAPTSYRYIFHAQRIVRVSSFDGSADGRQFKSDKYVPNEVVVFRFNADRNRSDGRIFLPQNKNKLRSESFHRAIAHYEKISRFP